jgi:transcriptional regulator with XRE-family HTH domain
LHVTNSLRNRILQARRLSALSSTALARRVGVSASAAAQWEHPRGTSPTLENLVLIAEATGVQFDWLAAGRGVPIAANTVDVDGAMALHPDAYARDLDEERLLTLWRNVPEAHRETLFLMITALAH